MRSKKSNPTYLALGVEAILQAMQLYALEFDLGRQFKSPRFKQIVDHETIWKYRGQIPQPSRTQIEMYLEVHLSRVEIGRDRVIVVGYASLWKPKMRIYEVKNVGFVIEEGL